MSVSRKKVADEDLHSLSLSRYVPRSPAAASFLRRLNALLSSYAGMDRVMMIIQYAGPLLGLVASKSAGFTHRINKLSAGTGGKAGARRLAFASSLNILSSKLSDARMLGRFFGLLPIISWIISLENKTTAPTNSKLRNIQRVQALSMLVYYPLEHAYYLASHGIITLTAEKKLKAILWACRAWAVYVLLQLLLYSEEAKLLSRRMANVSQRRSRDQEAISAHAEPSATLREKDQADVDTDDIVEQAGIAAEDAGLMLAERELMRESEVLINGVMTNLAYAPLTIHWSLPNGLFSNEVWSGVFMTIAGLSGLRASWRNLV